MQKYIIYMLGTILILLIVLFAFSFTNPRSWLYKSPSFEGLPFEQNYSLTHSTFTKEKLDKVSSFLKENSGTTSMLILENGKVVYEYGDPSDISIISSCRKSVLAMLYGNYVQEGEIDLSQTLEDLAIDDVNGLLPLEKQATIQQILSSRSGVFHLPSNGGYDKKNIKARGSVQPGSYFVYNNWDFNVAGHILELHSKKTVYEEVEKQLAIPLGFQDWNIQNQKRKVNTNKSLYSAYHMHLSTRDMAKIGQLMLQKGSWNGKQLITEDWINRLLTMTTPKDTVSKRDELPSDYPIQFSYGMMWWLFEDFHNNTDFEGAYTASGFGGQYITVLPKKNIVIAHKSNMDLQSMLGLSYRRFTPSWKYWQILNLLMEP